MENWLKRTLENYQPVNDWLASKREVSLLALNNTLWPTRKTEAWKYTPVSAIEKSHFEQSGVILDVEEVQIPNLDTIDIVFVNGQVKKLPDNLPQGISISSLESASKSEQQWALAQFNKIKPETHYFGLVNDVLASAGVIIDIAVDAKLERPIRLVNHITDSQEAHCRNLVRLGKGSAATIIEHSIGGEPSFNTHFSEYDIEEYAELTHYKLATQEGQAISINGCHFNLQKNSKLFSYLIGFGSKLTRLDYDVRHLGRDTYAVLNGFYLTDDKEHFDLHSNFEHTSVNGITKTRTKGIIAGESHAVFSGRIHIHPGAPKTAAEMNNRNLLLSHKAQIDTKPELEIYTDDVTCAHGATIAQVDPEMLYYMTSRGIDEMRALEILSFGFVNEMLDELPHPSIAEWLALVTSERLKEVELNG